MMKFNKLRIITIFVATLLTITTTSFASPNAQLAKLLASDAAANDHFGFSVAISGNTAIIGARWDDDNGTNSGSAYIYRFNGSNWTQEAKLTASDGAADDRFGDSVAISGDTALIGAYADDDPGIGFNSGSAYIFRYNGTTWIQEAKLLASDAAASDWFGGSVAISGDTAIIGAHTNDDNGSAYIFRYNGSNWTQEAKLTASDAARGDIFGVTVAISGDTAIIGAYYDDDNGSSSGSAYIFRYNGSNWTQEDKLTASDAAADDHFGISVAISGDTAIIGADRNDDNATNSGSAYIFRYNGSTWIQEAKLLASDAAMDDRFGHSVSISGNTAIIGADGDGDNGSAYIFRYNGANWTQKAKLTASDAAMADIFGYSVAISGNAALIGAYGNDDNGSYSGSAYIFGVTPLIALGTEDFSFSCLEEAGNPPSQSLSIWNKGLETLNWQISEDCPWLEIDPNTGSSTGDPNQVTLSVDIGSLDFGTYQCQLTITDPNALNSPQLVPVSLSYTQLYPFGDVDMSYVVDISDFGNLAAKWLLSNCTAPSWCNRADINHSTAVDAVDISIFAGNWQVDWLLNADPALLSHWKFEENGGTTALDSVGTNHGSIQGNPNWVPGKIGDYALDFDGVVDYVNLGNDSSLKPNLPVTLSAWIKLDTLGSYQNIVRLDDSWSKYYGVFFQVTTSPNPDALAISFGDGNGRGPTTRRTKFGTTSLNVNTWYHVVGVVRGATDMDIYINGVDDGGLYDGTGGSLVYSAAGSSFIGSLSDQGGSLNGLIDDVMIFNRALSAQEIQQLYQQGNP